MARFLLRLSVVTAIIPGTLLPMSCGGDGENADEPRVADAAEEGRRDSGPAGDVGRDSATGWDASTDVNDASTRKIDSGMAVDVASEPADAVVAEAAGHDVATEPTRDSSVDGVVADALVEAAHDGQTDHAVDALPADVAAEPDVAADAPAESDAGTDANPCSLGFAPLVSYAYVGQVAAPTFPLSLTVTLPCAPASNTFVSVTSSDPGILAVLDGGVTIAAGATSAPVLVNAYAQSAHVALLAMLGLESSTADVRVLDPTEQPVLQSLTPLQKTITQGAQATFTVTLEFPAPAGGIAVNLALNPANAGVLPATVVVPAQQTSASFDLTSVVEDAALSASLGSTTLSATVTTKP